MLRGVLRRLKTSLERSEAGEGEALASARNLCDGKVWRSFAQVDDRLTTA
jgi:hypothetical protein